MELKEILKILNRNKWIIIAVTLFTVVFSILFSFLGTKIYETQVKVIIRKDPLANFLITYGQNKDKTVKDNTIVENKGVKEFLNFLKSKEYKEKFYKRFYKEFSPDQKIRYKMFFYVNYLPPEKKDGDALLEQYTISLGFQSTVPWVSKKMAELFVATIKKDYAEKNKKEQQELTQLINQLINQQKQKVNELDRQIPNSAKKFKYLDLANYIRDQEQVLTKLIIEQNSSYQDYAANPVLTLLQQRVNEIQNELNKTKNPAQQKELKTLLAETKNRFILARKMVIASQKSNNRYYMSYTLELGKIKNELGYLKNHANDIEIKITAYKSAVEQLNQLLETKSQIELNTILKNIYIEEIKKPVFGSTPINKRPKKNISLSLILGLMLGLTIAVVNQYLSPEPLTKNDLEDKDLLFWGELDTLPISKRDKISLNADYEKYTIVRTKLLFDIKTKNKIFSVLDFSNKDTQLIPKLAASLAKIGYKVLIVDANFRDGFTLQRKYLKGLKDLIIEDVPLSQFDDLLIESETIENIYFLGSGGCENYNPTDLLAAPMLKDVCKLIKKNFDFSFFLTPANFEVADAMIMGQRADHIILLVNPEITDKEELMQSLGYLKKFNKNQPAIIFNN